MVTWWVKSCKFVGVLPQKHTKHDNNFGCNHNQVYPSILPLAFSAYWCHGWPVAFSPELFWAEDPISFCRWGEKFHTPNQIMSFFVIDHGTTLPAWWYTYPTEKYEFVWVRQLGWWHSQLNGKNNPVMFQENHQPPYFRWRSVHVPFTPSARVAWRVSVQVWLPAVLRAWSEDLRSPTVAWVVWYRRFTVFTLSYCLSLWIEIHIYMCTYNSIYNV